MHQMAYTEKVLKRFNMADCHSLTSPMVVRSLGLDTDPFRPKMDDEDDLGPEMPYLSAIGALMYLATHTRPDISFAVNLLSRFSSCPTQRHWNGIKHVLRYLQGTKDLGLYYTNHNKDGLVGLLMLVIYQIHIKLDHRQDMSLHMEVRPYHGVP